MNEIPQRFVLRSDFVRANLLRVIAALKLDDRKPWVISLSKKLPSKTEKQLGYFWGVVLPQFADFVGDHEDAFYEDLLEWFAPRVRYRSTLDGREKERVIRISEMNIEQMNVFIDRCIREAAGLGCVIPPAVPVWKAA
ncbi:MAG: hypothetical protein AB7Q97_01955 [Gammaproteobacteria bacterium]